MYFHRLLFLRMRMKILSKLLSRHCCICSVLKASAQKCIVLWEKLAKAEKCKLLQEVWKAVLLYIAGKAMGNYSSRQCWATVNLEQRLMCGSIGIMTCYSHIHLIGQIKSSKHRGRTIAINRSQEAGVIFSRSHPQVINYLSKLLARLTANNGF